MYILAMFDIENQYRIGQILSKECREEIQKRL